MQYELRTIFVVFLFVASSVGAFGPAGLVLAAWLLALLLGIRWSRITNRLLGCVVAWILFFLITVALLLPAVQTAQEAARRAQCSNNLRQIALALHLYHDQYRCFPPAYVCDKNGKPMHSWRVLILPYLENDALYKQYDFSEPWDGPKNRLLAEKMSPMYCCPSADRRRDNRPPMTSYVVVTGPGTLWPGTESRRLADCRDGTANTLLVAEVADSDIHWMEPRDPSLPGVLRPDGTAYKLPSNHGVEDGYFVVENVEGGGNVVLADASVRYLPAPLNAECLAALAADGDGKTAEFIGRMVVLATSTSRHVHWGHVVGLSLFVLSFLVLLWKAAFARVEKRAVEAPEQGSGDIPG